MKHISPISSILRVILCLSALTVAGSVPQAKAEENLRTISVVSEATFSASPDTADLLVSIESTAQSGKEAEAAVSAKVDQLRAAFAKSPIEISDRSREVGSTTGPLSEWKPGGLVLAKRLLVIRVLSVELAGSLADLALKNGADKIIRVSYSVRDSNDAAKRALALALERAKQKAEVAASALGVQLGSLHSFSETLEPDGEALRMRMEQGESPLNFQDRQVHTVINAQFEIKTK